MTTTKTARAQQLEVGDVIDGRYELESVLGKGGFGVVFRAIQKSTGQFVALKILRADRIKAEESNEVARFEREMQLIGKLNHPNVVRLIDFGTIDEDQVYTVIEYIDGVDLGRLLHTDGALRPSEAKYLMGQVLEALAAAHELGIVYRDLKPHNIMVSSGGLRRSVKLLDFGISAIVEDARDASYQNLTQEGRINGTPSYMAPEQLRLEPMTCATDIYSWGLVFLELLTGRKVVAHESYVEILAQQISMNPIPIPPEIASHPLGAVRARSVAKGLDERYPNVREVMLDLEECMIAPAWVLPWTGERARKEIEDSLSGRRSRASGNLSTPSLSGPFSTSQSALMTNPPRGLGPVPPPISSSTPMGGIHSPGTRRAPVIVGAVLLLLIGVGVAIILASGGGPDSAGTASTPPAADAATAQPTPGAPAPPTPPQTARVEVFEVTVPATPMNAELWIDGVKRATGGISVRMDMDGEDHTLEVRAEGYRPRSYTFNNASPPGNVALVPVEPAPVAQADPPPAPPSPAGAPTVRQPRRGATGAAPAAKQPAADDATPAKDTATPPQGRRQGLEGARQRAARPLGQTVTARAAQEGAARGPVRG